MSKPSSLSEVKRKADLFKQLFASEVGKSVLEILTKEFHPDDLFVPTDPQTTAYKLGRRDVIIYINQMLRYGNENQK